MTFWVLCRLHSNSVVFQLSLDEEGIFFCPVKLKNDLLGNDKNDTNNPIMSQCSLARYDMLAAVPPHFS